MGVCFLGSHKYKVRAKLGAKNIVAVEYIVAELPES
jgi:hypothetical protein